MLWIGAAAFSAPLVIFGATKIKEKASFWPQGKFFQHFTVKLPSLSHGRNVIWLHYRSLEDKTASILARHPIICALVVVGVFYLVVRRLSSQMSDLHEQVSNLQQQLNSGDFSSRITGLGKNLSTETKNREAAIEKLKQELLQKSLI